MVRAQFNQQFLEMAGYTSEELDHMDDLSKLTSIDLNKLIQEKSKQVLGLKGNSQKVVPLAEVSGTLQMDGSIYGSCRPEMQ